MSENENNENTDLENIAKKVVKSSQDLANILPMLGNVLWLYMQSKVHRFFFASDFETRVIPALLKRQCKLYLQQRANSLPMAYISWAFLSDEAEKIFIESNRIAPKDWNSGENIWLVDVLTPFGGHQKIYADLEENVFKGRPVYMLYPDPDQKNEKKSLREIAQLLEKDQEAEADTQDNSTKH